MSGIYILSALLALALYSTCNLILTCENNGLLHTFGVACPCPVLYSTPLHSLLYSAKRCAASVKSSPLSKFLLLLLSRALEGVKLRD